AGRETVMPEAAVAHDADDALAEARRDAGRAGEAQAVADHRLAEIERRQSREGVAADVARDMRRPELALDQLDRAEHRALRAAGAERRRPGRNHSAQLLARLRLEPDHRLGN